MKQPLHQRLSADLPSFRRQNPRRGRTVTTRATPTRRPRPIGRAPPPRRSRFYSSDRLARAAASRPLKGRPCRFDSPAPPTPTCTGRPPATGSASPTPSSSSRSSATCAVYGEEVKFGGGKVIRDGMGQSQASRAEGAVDTVITNALILDWTGIYKADVGLRDGRIARHRQGRQPRHPARRHHRRRPRHRGHRRRGPHPDRRRLRRPRPLHLPAAGRGRAHSGVTTLLGGGTGPAHGTLATTCTPGPLAHRPHAAGRRRLAGEHRHLRQGQRLASPPRSRRWSAPAPAR